MRLSCSAILAVCTIVAAVAGAPTPPTQGPKLASWEKEYANCCACNDITCSPQCCLHGF